MAYVYRLSLAVVALLIAGPSAAQGYVPAYERGEADRAATQVVFMYFGASWCGPCVDDEFKDALERAKVAVAAQAEREGKAFAAIGVSLDDDVGEGLALLAGSGGFDEVVVGRGWYNSAVGVHLMRRDRPTRRGLPTVIVFEGEMRVGTVSSEPTQRADLLGALPIVEWAAAGAPLD